MNPQAYFSWSYCKDSTVTDGRPGEKVDGTMNVAPGQPSSPAVGSTAEVWGRSGGALLVEGTGLSKMYFLAVFRGSVQGDASTC